MKKIVILLAVFVSPFFQSCDKITDPIQKNTTTSDTVEVLKRNIFFEDFTGQDCPNCPAGTSRLDTLISKYPNLIAVAIHAGGFAVPDLEFPTEYRTTAGNSIHDFFKPSGYPSGMANRIHFEGNSSITAFHSKWTAMVVEANKLPYVLGLKPQVKYDAQTRLLKTSVVVKFKDAYQGAVKVSALLIEDGIVGKQNNKGVTIEDYEFKHLLRNSIGDGEVWGKLVSSAPYAANSEVTVNFSNFTVKTTWVDSNCSLIVFAYDEDTNEVLQVEKIKIK